MNEQSKGTNWRVWIVGILVALVAIVALQNSQEVEVDVLFVETTGAADRDPADLPRSRSR